MSTDEEKNTKIIDLLKFVLQEGRVRGKTYIPGQYTTWNYGNPNCHITGFLNAILDGWYEKYDSLKEYPHLEWIGNIEGYYIISKGGSYSIDKLSNGYILKDETLNKFLGFYCSLNEAQLCAAKHSWEKE